MTLSIRLLPVAEGDAIWIELGGARERCIILVDGGPLKSYAALRDQVLSLPRKRRHIDLIVVTHCDADHIQGTVKLLADTSLGLTVGGIWFNGWPHLNHGRYPGDTLGPDDGEMLTALITKRKLNWNAAFDGYAVAVPGDGPLPTKAVGPAELTLIAPGWPQLDRLSPVWDRAVKAAGLIPGEPASAARALRTRYGYGDELGGPDVKELAARPFRGERTETNGSSIAFLLRFEGRSCLLTGDSQSAPLIAGLARCAQNEHKRVAVDAVKLPHHGSRGNVSGSLLDVLCSARFLVSTDGSNGNPDQESVSRVLVAATKPGASPNPHLWFNYETAGKSVWGDADLQKEWKYRAHYPKAGPGCVVEL